MNEPENESEATRLSFDTSHVDALHGVNVELPNLERLGQERIEIHGNKEALDGR